MDDRDMKERVIEHGVRINAMERLTAQHNAEMRTLSIAIEDLRKDLNSAVNKMIIALIILAFLSEGAAPIISKLGI